MSGPEPIITLNPQEPMLDITGAETVQIQVRKDRKVVWVNVDGVCRLRICRITGTVEVEQ